MNSGYIVLFVIEIPDKPTFERCAQFGPFRNHESFSVPAEANGDEGIVIVREAGAGLVAVDTPGEVKGGGRFLFAVVNEIKVTDHLRLKRVCQLGLPAYLVSILFHEFIPVCHNCSICVIELFQSFRLGPERVPGRKPWIASSE